MNEATNFEVDQMNEEAGVVVGVVPFLGCVFFDNGESFLSASVFAGEGEQSKRESVLAGSSRRGDSFALKRESAEQTG